MNPTAVGQGPLAGVRIVELAGIGPGPMAAMLLADLGATVVRIDRPVPHDLGVPRPPRFNLTLRNRPVIALDLKDPRALELVLRLVGRADGLIEGYRPGVAERLGLGPDECLARNPRLVYGRMTGWGQQGPLAQSAGHDFNYIAITGALNAVGRKDAPPTPPLNLLGDFAGGSMYLVMGLLAGILSARSTGRGQVVDAAIVDGAASLMTHFYGLVAGGLHLPERGSNLSDTGAHYADVYACADGRWAAVQALEPKFYAELLRRMEIDPAEIGDQQDRRNWPRGKAILAARFKTRGRDEWCRILEGTDACFAPVLGYDEAPAHPHNRARGTFVEVDGVVQPGPAPRFSVTSPGMPRPPRPASETDPREALFGWIPEADIESLQVEGVLRPSPQS
ncbi:MAG: CaiB/BaiF CoA transferase family protein [Gammaproteobacteria bacterium]